MKKVILFFILFFTLPLFIYADSGTCFIIKNKEENYILKSGDIITVNFDITNNDSQVGLFEANFKFYYNPYVFDIVEDNDSFFTVYNGWKSTGYSKYSSIVSFGMKGKNKIIDENYSEVYSTNVSKIKLKVKEGIKNQYTTIELIGEDSYVSGYFLDDKEYIKINCFDSKLSYEINNNATTNHLDSKLSYIDAIDFDTDDTDLLYNFDPLTYEYDIYTNSNKIMLDGICASRTCETSEWVFDLKPDVNQTIKIVSTSYDANNTTYIFNIIRSDTEEYDYPYIDNIKVLNATLGESFNKYLNTYHLVVPSTTSSLLIDYEANDEYNVIIHNNENFKIGENIVIIVVSDAKNYHKTKYYLIVNKVNEETKEEVVTKPIVNTNVDKSVKSNKGIYILSTIIISLIVISSILLDLFSNKKKSKNKKK